MQFLANDFQLEKWNIFLSSSCLRKAANVAKPYSVYMFFFGTSLDFTNLQYSKNIYQELTPKNIKNSFSIC